MKRIAVINLGSTSSKVAYFEDEDCIAKETIPHSASEIKAFPTVWDQREYREKVILDFLNRQNLSLSDLDAITTRGGHTEPLEGGVYRITKKMRDESRSERYGNHISDLGVQLAYEFQKYGPQAFTVDPPVTDEFEPLARFSGLPEIERTSRFHALNHKAVARRYAQDIGVAYEELNLIVVHMGGGTSVAPHCHGRMIDGTNGLEGDGPFSTNRSGGLPVGDLIDLCYSGKYTREEMHHKVNGLGGMMAYLGETDVKTVQEKALGGDDNCKMVLDAMLYQTAKEIGAASTVLCGNVDAILFTGGVMNSSYMVEELKKRVDFIAPVHVYPGEMEMESLGMRTYLALIGREEIKELI